MRWFVAAVSATAVAMAQTPAASASGNVDFGAVDFGALAAKFSPFDLDGDGDAEIVRLQPLASSGAATAPRVVVLVEQRLLDVRPGIEPADVAALRQRLDRFVADLDRSGHRAELVAAGVYAGARHQDGRTVLALRRWLRAVAAGGPLDGVILVGHFPDALLLRTCNWRRNGQTELRDRDGNRIVLGQDDRYLRAVPELVAHKCDLVLADLDGDWDGRYLQAETALPMVVARFQGGAPDTGAADGSGGACSAMTTGELRFRDAFHVHDGRAVADAKTFAVAVDDAQRDFECTAEERKATNAIAHPDIAVSRLDARGVAWSPKPEFLADGVPTGRTGDASFAAVWTADARLELQLLVDYFDRNHDFREHGVDAAADRPAAIAWGLGCGMGELRAAKPGWAEIDTAGCEVTQNVDLVAVVDWLARPAVLRSLRAHSYPFGAQFAATDPGALRRAIGGTPWNWTNAGGSAEPSFAANRSGTADFFFFRSLRENHRLPASPFLLLHSGCEAISPPGAEQLAYVDPAYGQRQHAESILFFTPCLAIVGRAKVFYDEPRGFAAALGEGQDFGAAWRRYFAIEGAAASWDEVGGDIGRKRSYFWSLLGDFTLRLPRGSR